jgi:succinylglutamate desuccinylase
MKDFCTVTVGEIFRFNENIFIRTEDFFSAQNIEEYLESESPIRDVDDMYCEYSAYNAICLSTEKFNPFSCFDDYTAVEVVEAELHIV